MALPDSILFPTRWVKYCDYRRTRTTPIPKSEKINIWAHRYRLAKSFSEIKFKEYSEETSQGYNGLFLNVLTYSTYEMFIKFADGDKFRDVGNVEKKVIREIRSMDSSLELIELLQSKCTSSGLKIEIEKFLDNDNINPIYLSALIRHIFVHGELTANINGIIPTNIHSISSHLSNYTLEKMDRMFSEILEEMRT